ncbi:MAG: universal stress protein [Methanocellales archaeon]|nr:universal stress protein [Methanocellales archaeon]
MIKKLLVAVDGSPEAEKAAEYALKLGKAYGADVTVLNVIGVEPPIGREDQRKSKEVLAHIKGIAKEVKVNCKTSSRIDPIVHRGIIEEAEEGGYDLIVIGSKGLTGIKRMVMGSVAENVVKHAHCPVTVIR